MHKFFVRISLLLGNNLISYGQEYKPKMRNISIKEGLSDRFVNYVYQDAKGGIWIGCNYGLNRYDGTQMKAYTKENYGLKNNYVHEIYDAGFGAYYVFVFNLK